MICPKCNGKGTIGTDVLCDDEEKKLLAVCPVSCDICYGTGEAASTMQCGHPIQCLAKHKRRGWSCGWCDDRRKLEQVAGIILTYRECSFEASKAVDFIANLLGGPNWEPPHPEKAS